MEGIQYEEFFENLILGNRNKCTQLVLDACENGIGLEDIYIGIFQKAMIQIGELWRLNKISVAKEHLCTSIIQSIMMGLYKYIIPKKNNGLKVIISCIGNELHEE